MQTKQLKNKNKLSKTEIPLKGLQQSLIMHRNSHQLPYSTKKNKRKQHTGIKRHKHKF